MLYLKQFVLLLICLVGTLQCEINQQANNSYENNIVSAILKYLQIHNSHYSYKSGRIVQSFLKDDKLEVTADIEISCDYPCLGGIIRCDSIFRKSPDEDNWLVAGTICAPQEPNFEVVKETYPAVAQINVNEKEKKHLFGQNNQLPYDPTVNENPRYQPCLGCPLDIDPHAEGVNKLVNAALKHVESESNEKHVLLNILKIQQQVVAGIKYTLLVEIAPTICHKDVNVLNCPLDQNKQSFICEVQYWEKPWIQSSFIIKNNCTISQTYRLQEPINTTKKPLQRDTYPGFLDELESQIIPEQPKQSLAINEISQDTPFNSDDPEVIINKRSTRQVKGERRKDNDDDDSSSQTSERDNEIDSKNKKKHDSTSNSSEEDDSDDNSKGKKKKPKNISTSSEEDKTDDSDNRDSKKKKHDCSSSSSSSSESKEHDRKNREKKHKHKDNKSEDSDSSSSSESSSSSSSSEEKDNKKNKGKHDKNRNKKRSINKLNDENYQSIMDKLIQIARKHLDSENVAIISSSKVILDSPHYKLDVLTEKDGKGDECSVYMTLMEDAATSTVDKVVCGNKIAKRGIPGGINDVSKDKPELKTYLNDGLLHMDSKSTHANRFKIKEIISASSQVVSGSLWRVKAKVILSDCEKGKDVDLETCGEYEEPHTQICNFKIWDQPWLPEGRQTNITCEAGEYSFRTKRHLDYLTSTEDKEVYENKRVKRGLLGGSNEVSKDNPKIKTYLNDGLLHLDSKSTHTNRYKIKEIISSSSQVVSGSLWRIKAKVILSDCEKGKDVDLETCGEHKDPHTQICNFKIWDQPWLPEGRQTNITCETTGEYSFRTRRSVDFDEELVIEILFKNFMEKHQKQYKNKVEYLNRLKVFKTNLKQIYILNEYEQGTAHYEITKFADLTPKEFSQLHGLRLDLQNENDIPFPEAKIPDIKLPTSFDWREKNAVTEVKDQGMCGSCWAFSTTGNIEGQYAIKYNTLKEFSEQELVDCDKLDEGCNGGLMDNAYRTIERLGGLESEKDYPYDAEDEKCHFTKSKVVVQLSGALNISHNETDMAKWLTQNGPISIAINANAMQFYAGGVSHPWKSLCNPKNLDHGVLIVGYGVHTTSITKKVLPYWIVKNSWGKSWGEQGYYRVYRGDGTCGLNQTPSSAIVA